MNLKELMSEVNDKRREAYTLIEKVSAQLDQVINTASEVIADHRGTMPAHTRRGLIMEIPMRLYSASTMFETLGLMESTLEQKLEVMKAECLGRDYGVKKSIADKEAIAVLESQELNEQLNTTRYLRYLLSDKVKYCYELLLSLKKIEDAVSSVEDAEDKPKLPHVQYKGRP